jgi:hypothetical protein
LRASRLSADAPEPAIVRHLQTYRSTLTEAVTIAGGEEALAGRLRVPVAKVMSWVSGTEPVPGEIFLRAVDVVLERGKRKRARP